MEETVIDPATLLNMPYELQQKIALHLDIQSTLNLCVGAKALKARICNDQDFWKAKYQQDFELEKMFDSLSWFENYKMKATGVLSFEFDEEDWTIKIYLGTRILGIISSYSEHYDEEPLKLLNVLEKHEIIEINEDTVLVKEGKEYHLRADCFESAGGGINTALKLILTKTEVIRLFKAMYSAIYNTE